RDEFRHEKMRRIRRGGQQVEEVSRRSDFLVRHPRLHRVRAEEIEEVAGIDEEDRSAGLTLDEGAGVGDRDRHAAETSSAYRDSRRHWSKKRRLSSSASSLRQVS